MRDILIVSDTHGRTSRLNELIEYRQKLIKDGQPLTLIYLGDGLNDLFSCAQYDNIICHAVRGNCDFSITDRTSPYGERTELLNHMFFMPRQMLFQRWLSRATAARMQPFM